MPTASHRSHQEAEEGAMTQTLTKQEISRMLAVGLDTLAKAKQSTDGERPFDDLDLAQLRQGWGILKAADQTPALPMTTKIDPGSKAKPLDKEWYAEDPEGALEAYHNQWTNQVAHGVETGRRDGLIDGKQDKSARRMRVAKRRAERKAQLDAIAASPVKPSRERLDGAWDVVLNMAPIITRIAARKASWAARYLGTVVDDIPQQVIERMVLVLAKSDEDLDLLRVASEQLGDQASRGGIPGDQADPDAQQERARQAKARSWLMGVTNNRVMGALVDAYTEQRNLRWENIDLIATVMASIGGVGDDPLLNRHKADRAPAMLGVRFQRPGGIDSGLLSQAITGAITERGLDRLVELLLDSDKRRTDGAFMWDANAEQVFLASPDGEWKWEAVAQATSHLANPRHARGQAARIHVRNTFEWLPSLIVSAVRAFEHETVAVTQYADGAMRAQIRSTFDDYHQDCARTVAVPTLVYATAEDAALAIIEHLVEFTTGDEVARSVAYA
jgi:hypothetical protein